MALPLTVQTETALAIPNRCHRSMVVDSEIGDPATEVGHLILIDNSEARREQERRSTLIDLETREDSRFTTKTPRKITNTAHEFCMKT